MIESVFKCACGAVTVTINGSNYSMAEERFVKEFDAPEMLAEAHTVCNCDHCCNRWGIDLCACGSGEGIEECDDGLECCGQPSQVIDSGQTCFKAQGSW